MKYIILNIIIVFSLSDFNKRELEGEWKIDRIQAYGSEGLTYVVGEMLVGDIITISDKIEIEGIEYPMEYSSVRSIESPKDFFLKEFKLNVFYLESDYLNCQFYEIKTNCEQELFSVFYVDIIKNKLYLRSSGLFYIASRTKS